MDLAGIIVVSYYLWLIKMFSTSPNIYISKVGIISPAGNSADQVINANSIVPARLEFPGQKAALDVAGFRCDISDAKALLNPMKLRRLGRLQVMCLLAAKKAGLTLDAYASDTGVYVGTGLGSLNETAAFIEGMVLNGEELVKPGNFVNSVHNAAASSLAVEYSLKGENITVAHREISFDAALGHAISALRMGRVKRAVVCGADELNYYRVLAGQAKGLWKAAGEPLRPLFSNTRGSYPGEGAAVCVLSTDEVEGAFAKVLGAKIGRYRHDARFYLKPSAAADFICSLLESCDVPLGETDLMVSSSNGDCALDSVYQRVAQELGRRIGRSISHTGYKQLCGDYKAASAFGFSVSALMLQSGSIAKGLSLIGGEQLGRLKTIISYTISRSGVHSGWVLKGL